MPRKSFAAVPDRPRKSPLRVAAGTPHLAQTLARRVDETGQTWTELEVLAAAHGLQERSLDAMYDAVSPRC